MSFLKQLLSPFIEFDEQNSAQTKPHGPSPANLNPASNAKPPAASPQSIDGVQHVEHPLISTNIKESEVNDTPKYSPNGTLIGPLPQHEKYFDELIEKANQTNPLFRGNDYKEFVDSKLDIDDITDEALKYQTVFNILKGSGLTKDKLLKTGQEYLNIVGRDLNVFQSAHAERYKKELGQKESEIKMKAEQLQLLIQQTNHLKKEINTLTQDLNLGADKLNTIKDSFLLAGEKKQDEIQRELQRIEKYF